MLKYSTSFLMVLIFLFGCDSGSSFTQEVTGEEFKTVLFDDFNDTNQTLWQKADWANGDPFYSAWCPEQIDINNSRLTLTLEQKDCHSYTHTSGEYRTVNTYKYGKYTARFQASDVNGTISSFFVYTGPVEGTEWDEIDIEILGKDATKVQFNYWRNGHEHPAVFDLGFDASLAMHTYSFVWHPDYIEWYVDDLLMYKVAENNNSDSDSLPVNAAKIIINLWAATGIDSWSGTYTDNTTVQTLYDYVKYEEFKAN